MGNQKILTGFLIAPVENINKVRKVLSSILHPERGGDIEINKYNFAKTVPEWAKAGVRPAESVLEITYLVVWTSIDDVKLKINLKKFNARGKIHVNDIEAPERWTLKI